MCFHLHGAQHPQDKSLEEKDLSMTGLFEQISKRNIQSFATFLVVENKRKKRQKHKSLVCQQKREELCRVKKENETTLCSWKL